MEMPSSFWSDPRIQNFLFHGFSIGTVPGFIALCLGIAAFAFLLESLRYVQAMQHHKVLLIRSKQLQAVCPIDSSSVILYSTSTSSTPRHDYMELYRKFSLIGADFGIWYSLLIMAYLLMLIVMSFNTWFLVSSVLGGGLGYFVFGQMLVKINLENCKVIQDTFCGTNLPDNNEGQSTPHASITVAGIDENGCGSCSSANLRKVTCSLGDGGDSKS